MSDSPPKKIGRPSSFSDKLAERLLVLATNGATEAQLAKAAGVSIVTLRAWKAAHPTFLVALKEAKDIADEIVEASLYRRATGYSHSAVKFFAHNGVVTSEKYVEHYPPDTTACIFWLKNRKPDQWRDLHKFNVEGTMKVELPSPEDAARILAADYALLPAIDVKVEEEP